jgi:hypothetical protein
MRSAKVALGLMSAVALCTLCGCETGRVNKLHAHFESVADISTFPDSQAQFASVADGIPPVPGSPTAAGPDGLQPRNDSEARKSPGSEKGLSSWPRRQPEDKFMRQ